MTDPRAGHVYPKPEHGYTSAGHAREPGLQPERTDLAWQRTALAAAACSLLLLHVAVRHGLSLATLLPAGCTAATAISLALLGRRASAFPITTRPVPLAVVTILLTASCLTALPLAI